MRRKDIPSAKIEYDPSDISKILVFVDKGKLNQVVYNLLTNSIKYSKRKTDDFRIRIEVEETKYTFVIKFLDWGIGVDDGYEDQIFEEGIRAPSAMQSAVTGSGFGLTVTKRIMQELGGDIKLGSKRNPTEFLLILPKRPTKVNQ